MPCGGAVRCVPGGTGRPHTRVLRCCHDSSQGARDPVTGPDRPAIDGAAAGLLTIALTGGDGGRIAASKAADHVLLAASADPRVVKELHVTTYHVLWELVHVFFEQPGLLAPGVIA